MTFIRSINTILWKNYIIRKTHWFLTLAEIIIPILLFILFAYARARVGGFSKTYINDTTYNEALRPKDLYKKINLLDTKLYYSPKTEFTENLIEKVRLKFHLFSDNVKSFENEAELQSYVNKNNINDTILGVVFTLTEESLIPKHLDYSICIHEKKVYWNTDKLYHGGITYVPGMGSEVYIQEGFLPLQMAIDFSYAELLDIKLPKFTFEEFPYPPHYEDVGIVDIFMYVLPLITVFGFVLLSPAILKRIVEEKATGIKQLMIVMGIDGKILWLGWLFHALVTNIISVILIVCILKIAIWGNYPAIEYSNGVILFTFLILYFTASVSLCFLMSTFFNKPNIAMVFGVLFWMLSYFGPIGILKQSLPLCFKIFACLIPNVALDFGYKAISVYEVREIGIQWSNFNQAPSGGESDMTMLHVLIMLIIDIFVYFMLTLYFDNIHPGEYGLPKRWNFPIMGLYDKFKKKKVNCEITLLNKSNYEDIKATGNETTKSHVVDIHMTSFLTDKQNIEFTNLNPGIKIRNLCKKYGEHVAVNNLNMDIYEGQITVLLGHNGAGKTTTMSMLTGMIQATNGNIFIENYNIKTDIDKIRSHIGVCPQYDLLFSDLNVYEHLCFFAKLKGLPKEIISMKCDELLKKLNLQSKKHARVSALSGGMKRKLCLGMALIGSPKLLVLDEPTSGLDVETRREFWDILLKSRSSTTILISTHFMEEADELGDRIAIMHHGNLICYGTPLYLKEKFGTGYQVILNCAKALDLDNVEKLIQQYIPNVKFEENGNEVKFILPFDYKSYFGKIFEELENNAGKLGINNIGLSVTKIEDVFMKVDHLVNKSLLEKSTEDTPISSSSINQVEESAESDISQIMKFLAKVFALLVKRGIAFKRKLLQFFIHWLIGIMAVILTIYLGSSGSMSSLKENNLDLNLNIYGSSSVYYSSGKNLTIEDFYKEIVESQKGNTIQVKNVHEAVVDHGIRNIDYYKQHIIIGAEFNYFEDNNVINVMYSNFALHGAPISFNTIMNAFIKSTKGEEYAITTRNAPLSFTDSTPQTISEVQIGFIWLFIFPINAYIIISYFIIFPQGEYKSKLRKLEQLLGIKSYTYWFTCFTTDYMIYIVYSICVALLLLMSPIFSHFMEFCTILLILLLYGFCAIPYAYLFGHSKTSASAVAYFLMSSLFLGLTLTSIIFFFELSGIEGYHNVTKKFYKPLFSLIPQFGFTYWSVQFCKQAVWKYNWSLKSTSQKLIACQLDYNPCCESIHSECRNHQAYIEKTDIVWRWMLASSIMYFCILLWIDSKFLVPFIKKKFLQFFNREKLMPKKEIGLNYEFQYTADSLKKQYSNVIAVKEVSFKVKEGTCFGLLGVNGAGKTSTFKILSNEEPITCGEVFIYKDHKQLPIGKDEYNNNLGYCPQYDALHSDLTAEELFNFFATLRGIETAQRKKIVETIIKNLDLTEYRTIPCGKYSGGNKRKVNIGLAIIGRPVIILLDEPTTGIDPAAKRNIWKVINMCKKFNASIIITSHSMDECEVLCDELAIMKLGKVKCNGTIQSLKKEYGSGFSITLKLKEHNINVSNEISEDSTDNLLWRPAYKLNLAEEGSLVKETNAIDAKYLIKEKFGDKLTLKDENSNSLLFTYKDETKRLSWLFKEMEAFVTEHKDFIQDYSISQATLEDVFLNIARDSE